MVSTGEVFQGKYLSFFLSSSPVDLFLHLIKSRKNFRVYLFRCRNKILMKKLSFLALLVTFISCAGPETENFFVFLHAIPDRPVIPQDSIIKLQQGHIQNINRLYSEGKLTAAGPFDGGGGLFFLKAASLSEARENLNTDPAVRAKRFNIEVHPFLFETGSICKTDTAPRMVTYHFIYFKSITDNKLSEQDIKIFNAGIDLLESKIIMKGYFADSYSRILITDTTGTEFFNQKLKALEVSFKNFYTIEAKNLWIARGTFCEDSKEKE